MFVHWMECVGETVGRSRCDGHTPPQGGEGTHLEMAAVKMCLLGCLLCIPPYQPLVADKLLIKQKLDTETNYCIVLLCGFDPRPRTECGTLEGTKKERS